MTTSSRTIPTVNELNEQYKKTVFLYNRRVSFTPVDLSHVKSAQDLEHGFVAAHIDSSIGPARAFDLFVRKTDGAWHAYATEHGHVFTGFASIEVVAVADEAKPPAPHADAFPHEICVCYVFKVLELRIQVTICYPTLV